jgi:hypothetical protein
VGETNKMSEKTAQMRFIRKKSRKMGVRCSTHEDEICINIPVVSPKRPSGREAYVGR